MIQNDLPAIFRDYNPLEDKMFSLIDNDGHVINQKYMPTLDDDTVINAYKQIIMSG